MKLGLILSSILASASAFTPISSRNAASTRLFEEAESEWKGAAAISGLTKDVKTVFPLEDIAKILPHRYPFALVDKVIEYEAGKVSFIGIFLLMIFVVLKLMKLSVVVGI